MIVVSFCDGKAVGLQALKDLGIKVEKYYAFEINKNAIKIAKKNHPEIIHLGCMRSWHKHLSLFQGADLMLAGVECKNWSIAGKQKGVIEGTSGDLIVYAVEALLAIKPKNYMFEMTPMKDFNERVFNLLMRSEPYKFDSAWLSMQSRKRNYYTDIYVDCCVPSGDAPSIQRLAKEGEVVMNRSSSGRGIKGVESRETVAKKAYTLTAGGYGTRSRTYIKTKDGERDFNINEIEEIQTLPENYTEAEGVSEPQRRKCIGNGWNLATIIFILKGLKNE